MKTSRSGSEGQTLLEFVVSAGLVAITLTGIGWLFHIEWQRARCANVVFETTHARLVGQVTPGSSKVQVLIHETPTEVSGEATCDDDGSGEMVSFSKLEATP